MRDVLHSDHQLSVRLIADLGIIHTPSLFQDFADKKTPRQARPKRFDRRPKPYFRFKDLLRCF